MEKEQEVEICNFFTKNQWCKFGDNCKYAHVHQSKNYKNNKNNKEKGKNRDYSYRNKNNKDQKDKSYSNSNNKSEQSRYNKHDRHDRHDKHNKHNKHNKNDRYFSYTKLKEISELSDTEMIKKFVVSSELKERIENTEFSDGIIQIFIKILNVLNETNTEMTHEILETILESTFFSKHIKESILATTTATMTMPMNYIKGSTKSKENMKSQISVTLTTLFDLSKIILNFIGKFRSKVTNIPLNEFTICSGGFKNLIDSIEMTDKIYEISASTMIEIKETYSNLKINCESITTSLHDILKDNANEDKEKKEKKAKQSKDKYENIEIDYKNQQIILSEEEITLDHAKLIQKHRTKGSYDSWERYFNTLFYLVREDCFKSLRTAINLISTTPNLNMNTIEREFRDIYYYNDAIISELEIGIKGIQFNLKFKLNKRYVSWSKRMIFGSLLVITNKDFSEYLFCTVSEGHIDIKNKKNKKETERVLKEEKEGIYNCKILLVDNSYENFFAFLKYSLSETERSFQIFESKAYFESYSHILNRLQKMNTTTLLPFKDVFINYLGSTTNMTPMNMNQLTKYFYEKQAFQVFSDSKTWPELLTNGFDKSQFTALKSSLRNKVAIIQGPPGTGKTYVGSKLVKILSESTPNPILIVCYTNHALDQFLKHLLKHEKSMIRIGGRCKDEELMEYGLNYVKRNEKVYNRALGTLRYNIHELARRISKISQYANIYRFVEFYECQMLFPKLIKKIVQDFKALAYANAKDGDEEINIPFMIENSGKIDKELYKTWIGKFNVDKLRDLIFEKNEHKLSYVSNDLYFELEESSFWTQIEESLYKNKSSVMNSNSNLNSDKNEKKAKENIEFEIDSEDEEDCILESLNRRGNDLAEDEDEGDGEEGNDSNDDNLFNEDIEIDTYVEENRAVKDNYWYENVIYSKSNIWLIGNDQKFQLCDYIRRAYLDDALKENKALILKFNRLMKEKKNLETLEDIDIIKRAKIVGMTTTGCSKYSEILEQCNFEIVVIEEAAEIMESHISTILTRNTKHLILIGDHKQLKPNPYNYQISTKYNLNVSLFERLINNGVPKTTLSYQRRMRPEFADFIRLIYTNGYYDHIETQSKPLNKGFTSNIFFFNHSSLENEDQALASKTNEFEASFIVKLANYIKDQNVNPEKITILTLYIGQILLIRKKLKDAKMDKLGIKVVTVDNYQGEENDYILLSLVRSNKNAKIGFVNIINRVCVAFSRAILGMYVFGNFKCILQAQQNDKVRGDSLNNPHNNDKGKNIWTEIIKLAKSNQQMDNKFTFQCQMHKNITVVETAQDFKQLPEGGCLKMCEIRLECGHVCKYRCHNFPHKKEQCNERCQRILKCGHKCPNLCKVDCIKECRVRTNILLNCGHDNTDYCYIEAKDRKCKVLTSILLKCGHNSIDYCYIKKEDRECMKPCEKRLKCNHICNKKCYEVCDNENCMKKVPKNLLCGHTNEIPCKYDKYTYPEKCKVKCEKLLECDHECTGNCGDCLNGTLHIPCPQICNRLLICGHTCKRKCSESCICEEICTVTCDHGYCDQPCFVKCEDCNENCKNKCEHRKCTKLCGEQCDVKPCNQPCKKLLKCKHQCMGLCGEVCPNLCKICDPENPAFEILFGYEDEENSNFFELDCKCVFEVRALDTFIETHTGYGVKKCPRCLKEITNKKGGNRYRSIFVERNSIIQKIKLHLLKQLGEYKTLYETIKLLLETKEYKDIINGKNLPNGQNSIVLNFLKNIKSKYEDQFGNSKKDFNLYPSLYNLVQLCIRLYYTECNSNPVQYETNNNISRLELDTYHLFKNNLKQVLSYFIHGKTYPDKFFKSLVKKIDTLRLYALLMKKNDSRLNDKFITFFYEKDFLFESESVSDRNLIKQIEDEVGRLRKQELLEISKAVGGRWYTCPNGHLYSVGDCGMTNQDSRCPDCNAVVGGSIGHIQPGNVMLGENISQHVNQRFDNSNDF